MYLFHATYKEYYLSIIEEGLGGVDHRNWDCSTGVVCLAPSDCIALSYAEVAGDEYLVPDEVFESGIVVLRVDVSGMILEEDPNIDDGDDPCLIYDGIIPPSRLAFHRFEPTQPLGLALFPVSDSVDA